MSVNKLSNAQRQDSKVRVITSIALVAVIIPTCLFGGYFFVALMYANTKSAVIVFTK